MSDRVKFQISSAAMAMLIGKASVQQCEVQGLLFGEVLLRTSNVATDHGVAVTEQRIVVIHQSVVVPKQLIVMKPNGEIHADHLVQMKQRVASSYELVGYFRSRRNIPHKLTMQERSLLKNLVRSPTMPKLGSFFVRITTEVNDDCTRHTTQYHVTHVTLSGQQQQLPFEVINLGDTSHSEYKASASSYNHLLHPSVFRNLKSDQTFAQIQSVTTNIQDQLDKAVQEVKLSQKALAEARNRHLLMFPPPLEQEQKLATPKTESNKMKSVLQQLVNGQPMKKVEERNLIDFSQDNDHNMADDEIVPSSQTSTRSYAFIAARGSPQRQSVSENRNQQFASASVKMDGDFCESASVDQMVSSDTGLSPNQKRPNVDSNGSKVTELEDDLEAVTLNKKQKKKEKPVGVAKPMTKAAQNMNAPSSQDLTTTSSIELEAVNLNAQSLTLTQSENDTTNITTRSLRRKRN